MTTATISRLLLSPLRGGGYRRAAQGLWLCSEPFRAWQQRAGAKELRAPSLFPSWHYCSAGIHLPRALGREEGLKWSLSSLPRLGILTGAERHYGRHSLGLVLFIVSTGLNVSGQLYLHVAEKRHHLQLLQRKQTERVRCHRWGWAAVDVHVAPLV